jgi:methyl-accepting chemotaxis protein
MEKLTIVDKVKFWQEQDRINQALIPRVIKVHDSVTELAKSIEGVTEHIVQAEARAATSARDSIEPIHQELQRVTTQVEQLAGETEQLQQQVRVFNPRAMDQLLASVKRARLQSLAISIVALIMAALSLVR